MTEFDFIDTIKALCGSIPSNEIEGIGDDCAIMPISDSESLLFTADMLVEDIHFLRHATTPYELGRKSLAVNLSDIAAMGARPYASLLSISLPEELRGEWALEFMRGYRDLCAEHSVALIGGDTTASKSSLSLNITAIGRAQTHSIKRRSAAQIGDIIAVTGLLGASGVGLSDILNGNIKTQSADIHRNPTPRVNEGLWLASHEGVNAMMDISDGVASDIRHILKASGVGGTIELSNIPIYNSATIEQALCSGEDYELLLTISQSTFNTIKEQFDHTFATKLHPIGKIIDGSTLQFTQNNNPCDCDFMGFTHY